MRLFLILALVALINAPPASAQGFLGSYTAWIGASDIYNSRGQRLWEVSQIIRQDRANYHRFNIRDVGDGTDPWFSNANARASLEQAVAGLTFQANQRNMIVQGGAWVQLDLYGWSGSQITGVTLMVWR